MTSQRVLGAISRFFKIEQFGSSIRTEIIAGVTTYLSIAYIFIVSPAIMSQAGIDPKASLIATVVSASLATIVMGLWANLPFAVAPGLTMSSYFVFVVVNKIHLSWQQALAAVFVSGILCVILTALPVRKAIIESIPAGLKRAITVSIGVFVATIGLFISHIFSFPQGGVLDISALTISQFTSPLGQVMLCGLVVAVLLGLRRFKFPAGMLVAIIVSAWLYHELIPTTDSLPTAGDMTSSFGKLDFSVFANSHFWLPVIIFFVLDFFEGIGEFIGLTSNTSIQGKDGNVPNMKQALFVDGMGTVAGSLLGTSSLIVFVESAVGINAGGRTGLTAVVCGILMALGVLVGIYVTALPALIPAQAAAGVLVYVGYLILSSALSHRSESRSIWFDRVVALSMGAISLLTFSLDKSLAFGFWAYFCLSLVPGGGRKPAYWLAALAALLTAAILLGS